jgi:Spy/CpxP family protein refolding chaperone
MTKILIALGSFLLVAFLAVPLLADGPGWNGGHHMWGSWGSDRGSCWDYGRGYNELSKEEQKQLTELENKFSNETNNLRNEIWSKSEELQRYLNSTNPDSQKLTEMQRELSNLRAEMDEKRLAYEVEARKILPDTRFRGGYGRGYYGHHMRGYGPRMRYGQRGCWD